MSENNWAEWTGGQNPVPGACVEIRYRDGATTECAADTQDWIWLPSDQSGDIIAYRVVSPTPASAANSERPQGLDILEGWSDPRSPSSDKPVAWRWRRPGGVWNYQEARQVIPGTVCEPLYDHAQPHPSQQAGTDLLAEFGKHPGWELSRGYDEDDAFWQVHRVNGGVNDREWTLIGKGDTPSDAILAALNTSEARGQ